jgi:ketosteroid isomerase-like protein
MRPALSCLMLCGSLLAACNSVPTTPAKPVDRAALERQVTDTELAFAKTMADRDLAAFNSFLSEETVFFSGPTPLRGKAAVTGFWKRFYEKPAAPFSWRPDKVEALDSGTLALSTGPVFDPAGKCIGRFTSIWRQEAPGMWKIVFDKGEPCEER